MGADLYIIKLDRKDQYRGFEVSEEARNAGYFRDCYNSSGLFAVMSANTGENLSWWQTNDRKELFNKNGEMKITGAKKFKEELLPIVEQFCTIEELKTVKGWDGTPPKVMSIEDRDFYREWAKGLIEFLDIAIKLKSRIIFSI